MRWVEDTLIKDGTFSLPGKNLMNHNPQDILLIDPTESPIERPKKREKALFRQEKASYNKHRLSKSQQGVLLLQILQRANNMILTFSKPLNCLFMLTIKLTLIVDIKVLRSITRVAKRLSKNKEKPVNKGTEKLRSLSLFSKGDE